MNLVNFQKNLIQYLPISAVLILSWPLLTLSSIERRSIIQHEERNEYSEIISDVGTRVELSCVIESGSVSRWQKKIDNNSSEIEKWMNMTDVCVRNNNYTKSRCFIEVELPHQENQSSLLKLVFPKLRKSDLGIYACERISLEKSQPGQIILDHITLLESVKVSHEFEYSTNSTFSAEGDKVSLDCLLRRGFVSSNASYSYEVRWRILNTWYNPTDFSQEKYIYSETERNTELTIKSITFDDAGWYACALWDAKKYPVFSPERVAAIFEIQVRVKGTTGWLIPFATIAGEILIVALFMLMVEKTKWIPPGDNSSDDESDDSMKKEFLQ